MSQETRTVLTASFLKIPELRKVVDGSGKPERARQLETHRLGLYLKSRDRRLSQNIREKVNHHELHSSSRRRRAPTPTRTIYGDRNWNFVKLINKVLQKWRNYGKFQSSTFDTIERRKLIEDQNTILELSGSVQELQNEVNCMNDSKDFLGC